MTIFWCEITYRVIAPGLGLGYRKELPFSLLVFTKKEFFLLNTSLHLPSKGKRFIWWRVDSHSSTFLG